MSGTSSGRWCKCGDCDSPPKMMDTCHHTVSPHGKWRALHTHTNPWTPTSWKEHGYPARQQPPYRHREAVDGAVRELQRQPPLVSEESIQQLGSELRDLLSSDKEQPTKFIIQAGDCAEPIEDCYDHEKMTEKIQFLHELGDTVEQKAKDLGTNLTPILMGRIAGQFAKSRSNEYDSMDDGQQLVSYRGDSVNDIEATATSREPDPQKLIDAYSASQSALSCISRGPGMPRRPIYTSHEGLLLDFESALTSAGGINYSTHFPWIGARTRFLGEAHVEYFRGIQNPFGIKVGPEHNSSDLVRFLQSSLREPRDNPIALITRFGSHKVKKCLPLLLKELQKHGIDKQVVWICDPMHGNTYTDNTDFQKRRSFETVWSEFEQTLEIHRQHDSKLVGLHIEATSEDVFECVGGVEEPKSSSPYRSRCDPRFNRSQAVNFVEKAINLLLKER